MLLRFLSVFLACLAACAHHSTCAEETKTSEAEAKKDDGAAGPRLGKYIILSYGATGRPPLVLGSLVLEEGGKYKAFLPGDKPAGEGTYAYDAAAKQVVWKDGPYKGDFGGGFEIDREGKTHKIRLKRTTIATNSTDGEK
ncbi:MAG: hypothetical protein KIS92_06435 [Planctomycetota bacterium]|nr:hypothetical protein [Planctomycetota bacterium]